MSKKMNKATKRRIVFFVPIALILIIYFVFTISMNIADTISLNYEKNKLEEELIETKDEVNDLSIEVDKLQEPAYIARYIRENYDYTKNGEYVLKLEQESSEEISNDNKFNFNYKHLVIIIGLIFLFVIVKKRRNRKKKNNT